MAWAIEQYIIGINPIEKYRKPKRDDAIIIPPSMAETKAILIHAEEHIRGIITSARKGAAKSRPLPLRTPSFPNYCNNGGEKMAIEPI
jgi:hypothetical protein